jgi:hypothetical protein
MMLIAMDNVTMTKKIKNAFNWQARIVKIEVCNEIHQSRMVYDGRQCL